MAFGCRIQLIGLPQGFDNYCIVMVFSMSKNLAAPQFKTTLI